MVAVLSMTMRVTRACEPGAHASAMATASAAEEILNSCLMSWSSLYSIVVVVVVAVVMLSRAAREIAERHGRGRRRHAAREAVRHQPVELGLRVLAQIEALRDQVVDRLDDLVVVGLERRIALSHGRPRINSLRRIAGRRRFRERDHLARAF